MINVKSVKSSAVHAPAIQPLPFAFTPAIVPPKNIAINAIVIISQLTDVSVNDEKDKTSDKIKLDESTTISTVISPNNTAGKNRRSAKGHSPFFKSQSRFNTAYSGLFRIDELFLKYIFSQV